MNQRIVSYSISSFCVCLLVFSPVSTFWRGLSSDLTAFQGTECQNWQSNRLYGWHPWDWASLCPQCVWRCWAALLRLVNWQPYALLLIKEFPRGLHKGPVKWRKKILVNHFYNLFSLLGIISRGLKQTFSSFSLKRQEDKAVEIEPLRTTQFLAWKLLFAHFTMWEATKANGHF